MMEWVVYKRLRIDFLIILLILIGCTSTANQTKVEKNTYNPIEVTIPIGEAKIIKFALPENSGILKCKGKEYPYYNSEGVGLFFLEVSYFSTPENFSCEFLGKEDYTVIKVKSIDKEFPFEQLRVNRKRVFLNEKDSARVQKEQLMLNKLYSSSESYPLFTGGFQLPVKTKITSKYGKKRLFNNKKQGQHLGTDFRARVGKEIRVTQAGKVVYAGDLFYTGGTVIVDHGLGVFSVYGHLSKLKTFDGEYVPKGAIIGLAGKTGRVTGPHLHWGVKVHGNYIDGVGLVDHSKDLSL